MGVSVLVCVSCFLIPGLHVSLNTVLSVYTSLVFMGVKMCIMCVYTKILRWINDRSLQESEYVHA